jgi:hypothetical protein
VRVPKIELEAYLDKVVCAYLARPDVIAELRRSRDGDAELQRVADLLAEARGELAELRAAVGAGRLTVASLIAAEPGQLAQIERLEQRERELSAPPALAELITPGRDAKRRWKAAPVAAKREVARLLLAPGILGQVRVTRAPTLGIGGRSSSGSSGAAPTEISMADMVVYCIGRYGADRLHEKVIVREFDRIIGDARWWELPAPEPRRPEAQRAARAVTVDRGNNTQDRRFRLECEECEAAGGGALRASLGSV